MSGPKFKLGVCEGRAFLSHSSDLFTARMLGHRLNEVGWPQMFRARRVHRDHRCTDGETGAQRGEGTCSQSHSKLVAKPDSLKVALPPPMRRISAVWNLPRPLCCCF